MKLLVLGGGVFVGKQIVRKAVDRGHQVTVFSRGRNVASLPSGVTSLVGDRRGDLSLITDRHWDAVIDTSGYRPSDVRGSCTALRDNVGLYAFISTLDVYPDHSLPGLDESAPTEASWDSTLSPSTDSGYRLLKAACEHEVHEAFSTAHLIFRSGLIVGAGDPTGRLSYWALRFDRGGEVLAPAPSTAPLQFIDVRDHARFVVHQVEAGATGTFNTTSPAGAHTFASLVAACASLAQADSTLTWVDAQLLSDYGVRPWTELPLWRGTDSGRAATMLFSTARAQDAGLTCRSVEGTVSDVLTWARACSQLPVHRGQLAALRERMLLLVGHEEGHVVPEAAS